VSERLSVWIGEFGDRAMALTTFSIIPAKPWHCGQMCRLLRHEHREAVNNIGIDAHVELRARFDNSGYRKAWLIDGKLAGLGGITGSEMESTGLIWLALSQDATRHASAVAREARRQVEDIMITKRSLVATILDGDVGSRRFIEFLGFEVREREGPCLVYVLERFPGVIGRCGDIVSMRMH
jgi:hypothetical protein